MSAMDPHLEQQLRQGFKYLNRFMLMMWRLGLGSWINIWPEVGGQIMVLVHIGRKSGNKRYTPLNYAIVDDELYCIAGFGHVSDWYRNMLNNPNVEVWLPEGWWAGLAEEVPEPTGRLQILRQVLIGSGIVAPLMGVNPHTLPDDTLDTITASYRLIHIRRIEARTGPGGPGDLAWIWPIATLLLLARRQRCRKR